MPAFESYAQTGITSEIQDYLANVQDNQQLIS